MPIRYYTAGPPGEGGEFDKIQDAVDQAVLDQSGVQDSVVKVLPGVYIEDINLAAGVNLVGAVGSRSEIQGTITMDLTSLGSRAETGVSLRYLTLRGVGTNPVVVFTGNTPQTAVISDCQVFPDTGAAFEVSNMGVEASKPSSLWVVDCLVERENSSPTPLVQHSGGLFAAATSILTAFYDDVALEINGPVYHGHLETQVTGQVHLIAGTANFLRPKVITGTIPAFLVEAAGACAMNDTVVQCGISPSLQGDGSINYDLISYSGLGKGVAPSLSVNGYDIEGVENFQYTPGNAAHWESPVPTTISSAVDRLAAAVSGLLGNPIP